MRRLFVAAAVAAAAALMLAGCVNNTTPPASGGGAATSAASSANAPAMPVVAKNATLARQVPAAIRSAGTLRVGTNLTYAPNEFKDSAGAPVGWDIDLARAIGAELGLKVEFTNATFANIIPAVVGGRYDLGVASFTDDAEREKQVDFVDYYNAGIQWAAPAGKTVDPDHACGLKVAVESGTVEALQEVPAKSKACVKDGKKAIRIFKYDGQDLATNALVLGQVDAMSADSPITGYAVHRQKGKIALAGAAFDTVPYGLAIAKKSPLVPVVKDAVDALIAHGDYQAILKSWGVEGGAVTSAAVDGASRH